MERLMENGALDVFFTPIYMKKNRPAYKLSVITKLQDVKTMESIIFKNTSTIGIRRYKTDRTILKREMIEVETEYGKVRVKLCHYEDEKYYYPEYEDIKKICKKTGLSFKEVQNKIQRGFLK